MPAVAKNEMNSIVFTLSNVTLLYIMNSILVHIEVSVTYSIEPGK